MTRFRQVEVYETRTLAPTQTFEMRFRPGVSRNMEAWSAADSDAKFVLELVDPDGNVVERDNLFGSTTVVNHQPTPSQIGREWIARLRPVSSFAAEVTLHVNYYTDEELKVERVERAKLDEMARQVIEKELNPRITLQGKRLTITGDPSLTKPLAKWTNKELDIPVDVQGLVVDRDSIAVEFAPGAEGYPNGSIVLRLKCPQDVVITKSIARARLRTPTFVARVGINLYGGALRLHSFAFELPPIDGNWVASVANYIVDIRSAATIALTNVLTQFVDSLIADGTLGVVLQRIETALSITKLSDIRITQDYLEFEYETSTVVPTALALQTAPSPRSPRIDHLVIVMMENRSFDHMMAAIVAGRPEIDRGPDDYAESFVDKQHTKRTFKRGATTLVSVPQDPPHDSKSQTTAADVGFVKSFYDDAPNSSHLGEVLNYQPRRHVPFFDFLSREFCICDNWRASLRGHTWPNRLYSLSGSSDGAMDNPEDMKRFVLYTLPTVCDVLEAQGVDWAYYRDDFGFLELYRRWVFDRRRVQSHAQFRAAVAGGNLPKVTWIEPNISDFGRSRGTDDHPPISILPGQKFLGEIYEQLRTLSSPNWLLAITYDESGGFWDHVPSERVPDSNPLTVQQGFRVPAFLVSPWLRPGTVCKTRFEHASLIRTVLDQFCAPEPIFDASNNKRA